MSITEAPTSPNDESAGLVHPEPGTRPRAREVLATTPTEQLEAQVTELAQRLHFGTLNRPGYPGGS